MKVQKKLYCNNLIKLRKEPIILSVLTNHSNHSPITDRDRWPQMRTMDVWPSAAVSGTTNGSGHGHTIIGIIYPDK